MLTTHFTPCSNTVEEDTLLTKEQFKDLLQQIDSGLRALPATAQVRAGVSCCGARMPKHCLVEALDQHCKPKTEGAAQHSCAQHTSTVHKLCIRPQVAKQQGEYIASLLTGGALTGEEAAKPQPQGAKAFR